MARLTGKKALVTGSSRGIGRAIGIEMAKQGASICITYHTNQAMAQQVKDEIGEKGGIAEIFQLDVCSQFSIRSCISQIKTKMGSIDILVNNAGINIPNDFDKINDKEWDLVINTNLSGAFRVSRECHPLINEGGAIINVSSVSGQYGGPRTTHYAVSKAGLISLTQNMAIFFAKIGVRVNAISPGLITTEMAEAAKTLGVEEKILLGRQGTSEEVAKVAAFLASEDASYITAQTINVNGGLYF